MNRRFNFGIIQIVKTESLLEQKISKTYIPNLNMLYSNFEYQEYSEVTEVCWNLCTGCTEKTH